MAKARKSSKKKRISNGDAWRRSWPASPDVRAWMECLLAKADEIDDPSDHTFWARLAIRQLATLGHVTDALRHVERVIKGLPPTDGSSITWMLDAGAEISFDAGDMKAMSGYLERILATQPLYPRKCDRGCCLSSVRSFKARRGLLDPDEAEDNEQRDEARFNRALRLADEAIESRKFPIAGQHLHDAEKLLPSMEAWRLSYAVRDIISRYAKAGDAKAVRRMIKRLDADDQQSVLDARSLLKLGERKRAIARTETDIQSSLTEMSSMKDPNVHGPAARVQWGIEFLLEIDERKRAAKWLATALEQGKSWKFKERGFASAAVFRSLAKVTAEIKGGKAAEALLELAMTDAKGEKRSTWRAGAVQKTIELRSGIAGSEVAIEQARKMRSSVNQRQILAPLLAKVARWDELHVLLAEAATPKEAAELCWSIKFVWAPAK